MSEAFDPRIINAFLKGTINVLKTMCQTDPVPGKPVLMKDSGMDIAVTGGISLICPTQKGIAVLAFSKEAILKIVSRMFYEEITEVNEEVKDAVGELTNMIAGDSRKHLQAMGLSLEASIPKTALGESHEWFSKVPEGSPVIVIPFEIDEGHSFRIELNFEKT